MPEPVTGLYNLARAILTTLENAYADAADDEGAPEGLALPARRYVAEGPPAYDCEQVVVAFARSYPGLPFQENPAAPVLRATLLRSVTLAVHVVRCIPTISDRGVFPKVEALDASARNLLVDAFLVPGALVRGYHAGAFAGLCDGFGVREVVPAEPSGGFGGIIATVDVQF